MIGETNRARVVRAVSVLAIALFISDRVIGEIHAVQGDDLAALEFPEVGFYKLQVLSPRMLELMLVTSKKPDPAGIETWNFVDRDGKARLPSAASFVVSAGETNISVRNVGFKRRGLYAPLKK